MAIITLNNSSLKKYIDLLQNLDLKSKRKIILKLSESINEPVPNKNNGILSLFGAWEDSRDSDEIIKDIKDSRINSKDIESF
jgi:hypothetical protein